MIEHRHQVRRLRDRAAHVRVTNHPHARMTRDEMPVELEFWRRSHQPAPWLAGVSRLLPPAAVSSRSEQTASAPGAPPNQRQRGRRHRCRGGADKRWQQRARWNQLLWRRTSSRVRRRAELPRTRPPSMLCRTSAARSADGAVRQSGHQAGQVAVAGWSSSTPRPQARAHAQPPIHGAPPVESPQMETERCGEWRHREQRR